MDKSSYLNLDIRALHNFLIIMETGSITATANQLNVTQSGVSHSLEKLREIFQDPLFLRAGRGIKPTPRAQQLFEELKPMLANMKALTQSIDFEPATADIHWTIAANDFQRDVVLPAFYQRVAQQVERFSLNIIPSEIPATELLRDGEVDLVISPIPPDAPDILQKRLFSSTASCFYDATCRSAPADLEDFKKANYISLTFMAGKQRINKEDTLSAVIEKNITLRVANFSGIANFLRNTELLVIVPTLMKNSSLADFDSVPLPYPSSPLNMYMLWHQRYQDDTTHHWLRKQLTEISEGFDL